LPCGLLAATAGVDDRKNLPAGHKWGARVVRVGRGSRRRPCGF
jgi:hypothetical protein